MKYIVKENGQPATYPGSVDWNCSTFNTYEEALIYARQWIGTNCGGSEDGKTGVDIPLNGCYCFYHEDFCDNSFSVSIEELPEHPLG